LSASGLPAGVTASFGTNPTTSNSVLTLTASSTATTGTATVTVTGTSGALTHTTTVSLTVNAPAQPDYSLSASPTSVSVTQGGTGNSTITVTPVNGFTGSVTLSTSTLPSGVTAAFGTNPTTSTSVLTFTASSTATTGTTTVTVTGTSGALTRAVNISLTVNPAGGTTNVITNGGFETGTTTAPPWTLTAGVLNTSASEPPHSGAKDAWLDGYGTTHTDTATQTVTIPSTATTATLTFWLHIDTAETTTTTAFDVLSVQVLNTGGTVLQTLGTFSNLNKAAGYTQRSFNVIAFKGQTVQIRFRGVEDSSLQTSFVIDDVALNVQ
jgi:zinc metalloprotease ZmpA